MGTRSLTIFKDENGEEIVVLYRQFDGYPSGHGQELADILKERQLVNGYSSPKKQINGMGCCAALVTAALKDDQAGGVYLYPAGTRDTGEDYIYTLYPNGGRVSIRAKDAYDKILFDGDPAKFDGDQIETDQHDEED